MFCRHLQTEVHSNKGVREHLLVGASFFFPCSPGLCLDTSILLRVPGSLGKFPETGGSLFSRKADGNWGIFRF